MDTGYWWEHADVVVTSRCRGMGRNLGCSNLMRMTLSGFCVFLYPYPKGNSLLDALSSNHLVYPNSPSWSGCLLFRKTSKPSGFLPYWPSPSFGTGYSRELHLSLEVCPPLPRCYHLPVPEIPLPGLPGRGQLPLPRQLPPRRPNWTYLSLPFRAR